MICIWVMLGLYVAAAYLLDSERGEEAAARVKQSVSAQWRQCLSLLRGCPMNAMRAEPRSRMAAMTAINEEVAPPAVNEEQLAAVMREVEKVGASARDAVERSREALADEIAPLQERLEQLADRCEAQEAAAKALDSLVTRLDALERQLAAFSGLPQQVGDLQNEVRPLQEGLKQLQENMKAKPAAAKSVVAQQQPKPKTSRPKKG